MSEAKQLMLQALALRWARWQTRALVRVWPGESRSWGEAIAAEAEEIERPLAAVSWALGGATVYLRALGAHLLEWLKMPVGQRSGAMEGGPGPKRSRLFAVVVLASAAGLLCLPEGREAIRTVKGSWENYAEVDASQGELEKLAARAEKENDAQALAFAALGIEDGKRAMDLADRAVKLDSRFFWIYEARFFFLNDVSAAQDWIGKAQSADPQNATPYLRAADVIANRIHMELVRPHSPTEAEENQALTGNAEWVALMDKAFRAPTYNSFLREHQELNSKVWRRNPQLSLTTVLPGVWRHPIPNLLSLMVYTKVLVKRAHDAETAGHLDQAQQLLSEAQGFGERMEKDSERSGWFRSFGLSLERESALGRKAFYESTGQTAKTQEAAQQVTELEERGAAVVKEGQRRWQQRERAEGSGWAVQVSALAIPVAALLAGLGIGLFEIWPAMGRHATTTRRVLSSLADFAPAAVLLASAVFLLSFVPYARTLAAFREGSGGTDEVWQVLDTFWNLERTTRSLAGPSAAVFGWTVLTVVLSLVAGLILARIVYRAMRRTSPQA
jgi:hypothetical protein